MLTTKPHQNNTQCYRLIQLRSVEGRDRYLTEIISHIGERVYGNDCKVSFVTNLLVLHVTQKSLIYHTSNASYTSFVINKTYQNLPRIRYIDDTFTTVHKDEIDAFHDHLNEQNTNIQFTKEIEENGKLPFLDCLVSRDNNELRTTVYRKPTHTDRLLDESSYNPTSHKATTIKTLTRQVQLVCDTLDSLGDENKYPEHVFHKNNYNADLIRRNIYRPTEAEAMNRNPTPVTTMTIPHSISWALLRPSHGSYSPTTSVLPTNLQLCYDTC